MNDGIVLVAVVGLVLVALVVGGLGVLVIVHRAVMRFQGKGRWGKVRLQLNRGAEADGKQLPR